jgi:hypothetical protein
MNVSTAVRKGLALTLIASALAACSDINAPASPPASIAAPDAGPAFARSSNAPNQGGGPPASVIVDEDAGIATLVIDPGVARTYSFGQHSVYFPARSICDPATAGYGEELFDAPCRPLRKKVVVSVRWNPLNGHAAVIFQPQLRFVPSRDPSQWVLLTLHDKLPVSDLSAYQILWFSEKTQSWIDESKTDWTLRARTDSRRNTVYRRIKHFSGYMINAGLMADEMRDPMSEVGGAQ